MDTYIASFLTRVFQFQSITGGTSAAKAKTASKAKPASKKAVAAKPASSARSARVCHAFSHSRMHTDYRKSFQAAKRAWKCELLRLIILFTAFLRTPFPSHILHASVLVSWSRPDLCPIIRSAMPASDFLNATGSCYISFFFIFVLLFWRVRNPFPLCYC